MRSTVSSRRASDSIGFAPSCLSQTISTAPTSIVSSSSLRTPQRDSRAARASYRFQHGNFTQITSASGWMQPSPAPNNQLVAVRRQGNNSDLYLLSTATGKTVGQLTDDSSTRAVENNHWVFYPRLSRDGQTVFYAYDQKDGFGSYRVDLAIFASPLDPSRRATVWTRPNEYTGGGGDPVPPCDGGPIYTKDSNDDSFQVHSQIWIQRRAGRPGVAPNPLRPRCPRAAASPAAKPVAQG